MNMNVLPTLFVFIFLTFGSLVFGQETASLESGNSIFAPVGKPEKKAAPVPAANRFHKKFPQLFNGMAIEIAASTYPLDRANPAFRQFGNVFYEKLQEGGYSYLIMANFSSKAAALHFVESVVKPKTEGAKLFEYKDGIRKVLRE